MAATGRVGATGAGGALGRAFRRVVRVEADEVAALLWACGFFFFVLSTNYVLRPVRDVMGTESGGEGPLSMLFQVTLGVTLIVNPAFSALVARYTRRVFIPVVYRFVSGTLLVFYASLHLLPGALGVYVARAFFVWSSVFNLLIVSVFWGLMADLFRAEQGKRLFGFIGVGGTLGAIGGSLTAGLAPLVGTSNLILIAAAFLEVALLCMRRLVRCCGERKDAGVTAPAAPKASSEARRSGLAALTGVRLVLRSPYLLGICFFLLMYALSSTILYFEQREIVTANIANTDRRTHYFSRIDLFTNLLGLGVQALLTGRIITAIGVGPTLTVLPVITVAGLFALQLAPGLAMLFAVQVVRRASEYALVKPAREVLYTVVSREEKYSSKSLIDTFVYRGGDAVGALFMRLLSALHLGTLAAALSFVPMAIAWAATGLLLGRRQHAHTESGSGVALSRRAVPAK